MKPSRKRELAADLIKRYGASLRKVCAALKLSRQTYLYRSSAKDSTALLMRMKEIS